MLWLLSIVTCAEAARHTQAVRLSVSELSEEYDAFRSKYRSEDLSDADYEARLALYEVRRQQVLEHNAQEGSSWVAGLNQFADFTHEEFRAMLGYDRSMYVGVRTPSASAASSFLDLGPYEQVFAETVDWRQNVSTSQNYTHNQGACGSCWAVAAAAAMEMHMELALGHTVQLSYEQLVDCVPNPHHCGGKGGCQGATAPLAFNYTKHFGIGAASSYKGYASGGDGTCRAPPPAQQALKIHDYVTLEPNKLGPLTNAMANVGPVVVSVDAGDWSIYQAGVFDSCSRDAVVNHAVLLVGYGRDQKTQKDYWLIRNSWGTGWGEDGHIRVLRHSTDSGEDGYCGIDRKPQDGNGCDGGPPEVPVCGMCGILSDSSYPVVVKAAV
eukprot:gb/GFBE01059183.1/.p1 GENE.gb/GFBE01059183.1/~~gb/GFBE01059183.1/.p1  ORF type:complete len:382 (+),score=77.47 gb/GFBE01059183.1/:1-1146(+)